MAKHIKLGKLAEEMAATYLEEQGYLILDRNWHYGRKEIDIVATKNRILHIIEVKCRSYENMGPPSKAVDRKKRRTLRELAARYLIQNRLDLEIQFDIISIVISGNQRKITHIPEAILPFDF